jgi:hypothetical protein
MHLNDLEAELSTAGVRRKIIIHRDMRAINQRLQILRRDMVYVSEAKAIDNVKNLGKKWFFDKKRMMSEYEFNVAIDNQDPSMAAQGFYPGLSAHNLYEDNIGSDYKEDKPFFIAMDYQHSISPMTVSQVHTLPWETKPSINFINEFYSLHPRGLEDTIYDFCNKYTFHKSKVVYYIYDHTAVGDRVSAKPVKDIVVSTFRQKGWAVVECYTGVAPQHFMKYEKMRAWMEEKLATQLRNIRFNQTTCPYTLISMQGAGTVIKNGKTQKQKQYELTHRFPKVDQRETTHFSDCVDMTLWYFFGLGSTQQAGNASPLMFK